LCSAPLTLGLIAVTRMWRSSRAGDRPRESLSRRPWRTGARRRPASSPPRMIGGLVDAAGGHWAPETARRWAVEAQKPHVRPSVKRMKGLEPRPSFMAIRRLATSYHPRGRRLCPGVRRAALAPSRRRSVAEPLWRPERGLSRDLRWREPANGRPDLPIGGRQKRQQPAGIGLRSHGLTPMWWYEQWDPVPD